MWHDKECGTTLRSVMCVRLTPRMFATCAMIGRPVGSTCQLSITTGSTPGRGDPPQPRVGEGFRLPTLYDFVPHDFVILFPLHLNHERGRKRIYKIMKNKIMGEGSVARAAPSWPPCTREPRNILHVEPATGIIYGNKLAESISEPLGNTTRNTTKRPGSTSLTIKQVGRLMMTRSSPSGPAVGESSVSSE